MKMERLEYQRIRRHLPQVLGETCFRPSQTERPVRHHAGKDPTFVEALPSANSLGLFTDVDMRGKSLDHADKLGKTGSYYYLISMSIDDRGVRANRIRKSIGTENTFSTDLTSLNPSSPSCSR